MARLKDIRFHFKGKSGEEFSYVAKATVSDSGEFAVTVDDALEDTADSLGILLQRPKKYLRVEGRTLDDCKRAISKVGEAFVEAEVAESEVILYAYGATTHFTFDEHGDVQPNGVGRQGFEWFEPQGADTGSLASMFRDINLYSVGMCAAVYTKVTYIKDGKALRSEYVANHSNSFELNSFIKNGAYHSKVNDLVKYGKLKEITYTPEAEQFFYNVMIGMCKVSKSLTDFLSDDTKVAKAISGDLPLAIGNTGL